MPLLNTPKFWNKNNFITYILYPFSLIYFLLATINKIKQKLFKKKINIKTICIGNIYVGGGGKTPLVQKIYKELKKNKKICVIKKYKKNQIDEINMLKNNVEVLTPKSRLEGLIYAEKKGYEIAILDDGMQDFSFKKDKSVLCIKSTSAFGNEKMLPAGPLREPLNTIKRYDIAVINGEKNADIENKLIKYHKDISLYYSNYYIKSKDNYLNQSFLAFSGIANNKSFFDLMLKNNIKIKERIEFPDHHNFTDKEMLNLIKISNKKNLKLITTEKNYSGISDKFKKYILCLKIEIEIKNFGELLNEIN